MAVNRVALDEFDPAVDAIEPSDQTRFNLFEYSVVAEDIPPTVPQLAPLFIALDEFDPANDGYVPSDLTRLNIFEFALQSGGICDNLGTFVIDSGVQTPDITLGDILNEILDALLEPRIALVPDIEDPDIPSGLWSIAELVDYLEQRRSEFLSETEAVYRRHGIVTIPQQQRHPLPDDWILTRRVAFHVAANDLTHLHQVDEWEMDQGFHDWQKETGPPQFWMDVQVPRGIIQTAPAASNSGQLQVLFVGRGTSTLAANVPQVTSFNLPNELIPPLKWGALAMALGKVGRGYDPERAAYAESRYREGIAMTKMLLDGLGSPRAR